MQRSSGLSRRPLCGFMLSKLKRDNYMKNIYEIEGVEFPSLPEQLLRVTMV